MALCSSGAVVSPADEAYSPPTLVVEGLDVQTVEQPGDPTLAVGRGLVPPSSLCPLCHPAEAGADWLWLVVRWSWRRRFQYAWRKSRVDRIVAGLERECPGLGRNE